MAVANAKAQIADLLCAGGGEQKFSADRLGDELFLSATQPRDMYGLLLSAFQSQDVGYRGAMVKEKPSVLPASCSGWGSADSSTASCCTRSFSGIT